MPYKKSLLSLNMSGKHTSCQGSTYTLMPRRSERSSACYRTDAAWMTRATEERAAAGRSLGVGSGAASGRGPHNKSHQVPGVAPRLLSAASDSPLPWSE